MKFKAIKLTALITVIILSFNGCITFKKRIPNDEKARLQSVEVMNCFNNNDTQGLKELFCEEMQTTHDLDAEIQGAFDFIDGNIISYDDPEGSVSGGSRDETGWVDIHCSGKIENIKTDTGRTYRIVLSSYLVNKEHPNQVGITGLAVLDVETMDSEYNYPDYGRYDIY